MQLQQEKQTAKFNLLRKCGLLANIFKKLLDQKTFICLRLVSFYQSNFNGRISAPEAEFPAGQQVPVQHPIPSLAEHPRHYT